jgi:hypothetical protein
MKQDERGKPSDEGSDLPELGWPRRVARSWGWSLLLFVIWLALLGNAVRYLTFGVTALRVVFLAVIVALLFGSAVGTVRKFKARRAREN